MRITQPSLVRGRAGFLLGLGLVAVWTMASGGQVIALEPSRKIDPPVEEFERLAEVFRLSGVPNVKGKACVAIDTGPLEYPLTFLAWLIEDGLKEVTVFDWNGKVRKLRKPAAGENRPSIREERAWKTTIEKIRVARSMDQSQSGTVSSRDPDHSVAWKVQPVDFVARSKKLLAESQPEYKDVPGGSHLKKSFLLGDVTYAARLAHFAHQLGHNVYASKLYNYARATQKTYADTYSGGFDGADALYVFVANHIASGLRHDAIEWGTFAASRQETQSAWLKIAAIPYHRYRDEAREMVKHYQILLEEDRRWVEPNAKALAKLTAERKVAYWLYHLRDLESGQLPDKRGLDVARARRPERGGWILSSSDEPNPAEELKKLGLAAVPQLIAHLTDARPTRYVAGNDDPYVLRYGDCCQQIFESITCRTIYTGDYPVKPAQEKERLANAKRWWQDFQIKGEKQMLIDGTATGDRDSPTHAQRLAEKYPGAALAAIAQGARASKNTWVRTSLIQTADQLKDAKVVDFLRAELEGPCSESRAEAAMALVDRGDPLGAKVLIREWKQLRANNTKREDDGTLLDDLLHAMILTCDPVAFRLVGDEMRQFRFHTRRRIIDKLAWLQKDFRNKALTKKALDAFEDLLMAAMDDSEEEQVIYSSDGKTLYYPMLADRAASALVERWKQPKLFDIYAPLQTRERQRLDIKNIWLQKRGKAPLPVPARQVTPLPEATVQPLVKALLNAKSHENRKHALKVIEDAGLPALPAVRKLLGTLNSEHPANADVQALAKRMALIVREVNVTADSAKPSDAFRRKLELLQGKPITEAAFMDLLREFTHVLPAGGRITFERLPDDSGVYVVVTLSADLSPRNERQQSFYYGSHSLVDEKDLGGENTSAGPDLRPTTLADNLDWSKLSQNLRKVLSAKPNQYLYVQAQCGNVR